MERRQRRQGGFPTKKAAQDALARLLATMQTGAFVAPDRITVAEYMNDEWLPVVEEEVRAGDLRATTLESYRGHVECHIVPRLGSTRLQKLTRGAVSTFLADLRQTRRRTGDATLSPTTVRRIRATLHRALADAVEMNYISGNPATQQRRRRASGSGATAHEMKTWSADELRTFIASTHGDRLAALWHLCAMTGVRRGEALGLRWEDVDLEAARISVRHTIVIVGNVPLESRPKTKRGVRVVSLDQGTVAALREHRKAQLEERLAWGPAWTDTGLVFTREDGTLLHPNVVSRSFKLALKRAGLPPIRLHDLRHTHATLALQAGVPAKVVSERLGHAGIGITLDTYSHVLPGMQEEAAATVANLVFAPTP
jgi:integrase